MKIGPCDTEKSVLVIAEIGNNHEGDFELAKRLVAEAANAKADVVKFQTIVPERLVSLKDEKRIQQLKRFQFSPEQFRDLAACAQSYGVQFMSTPFDLDSVDWLDRLVPAWKIASSDNDFLPLLDRVAATGKPVLISMGLGHHKEAEALSEFFEAAWTRHGVEGGGLALLHCVVSYPTPDEEAGLSQISRLKGFGVTPGYSDHTLGIKAAELAVAAGARVIEKHFTLDKNHSDFRDHSLSADPAEFRAMVEAIRKAEQLLGGAIGAQACEEPNRQPVRRSLAAAENIAAGSEREMSQLVWVRPGNGVRPGEESTVLGKRLRRTIEAGEMIRPEDVE